jgi:hypothetical protein
MPLKLKQVDYSVTSKWQIVAHCLSLKVKQVKETNGIGAHSCCSYVSAAKNGEEPVLIFGNSRNKVAFKPERWTASGSFMRSTAITDGAS